MVDDLGAGVLALGGGLVRRQRLLVRGGRVAEVACCAAAAAVAGGGEQVERVGAEDGGAVVDEVLGEGDGLEAGGEVAGPVEWLVEEGGRHAHRQVVRVHFVGGAGGHDRAEEAHEVAQAQQIPAGQFRQEPLIGPKEKRKRRYSSGCVDLVLLSNKVGVDNFTLLMMKKACEICSVMIFDFGDFYFLALVNW